MLQDFQIVSLSNEPQTMLCVQFMYKGLMVAASKILRGEVVAFDENDNIVFQGHTIEDVITKINGVRL